MKARGKVKQIFQQKKTNMVAYWDKIPSFFKYVFLVKD